MEDTERLKKIRAQLGWTQAQLGEALDLDKGYINQMENGKRPVQHWVVRDAQRLLADEERRKEAQTEDGQLRMKIRTHIEAVLSGCDRNRLAWLLVELQRLFPVQPQTASSDERKSAVLTALDLIDHAENGTAAALNDAEAAAKPLPGTAPRESVSKPAKSRSYRIRRTKQ